MACCLEVVLFSYSSQRTFPWIINIFKLAPFYFFKVSHTQTIHTLQVIIFSFAAKGHSDKTCVSFLSNICVCAQVIEVFIRSEEGLSRDMVKHLNQIEEQVLESRAWSADSALWSALQAAGNKVPTVEEVSRKHTHRNTHILMYNMIQMLSGRRHREEINTFLEKKNHCFESKILIF